MRTVRNQAVKIHLSIIETLEFGPFDEANEAKQRLVQRASFKFTASGKKAQCLMFEQTNNEIKSAALQSLFKKEA